MPGITDLNGACFKNDDALIRGAAILFTPVTLSEGERPNRRSPRMLTLVRPLEFLARNQIAGPISFQNLDRHLLRDRL